MTVATVEAAAAGATPGAGAIPFTIASRPQKRFSNIQTVSNLSAGGTFQPIVLAATGWVRKVVLLFTQSVTATTVALLAGDGPWNLVAGVTLSDATGQPIFQPVTGYQLYLINKYMPAGSTNGAWSPSFRSSPQVGREHAYSGSGASGAATFRLVLEFEQDAATGYGCIPNLDSNASLQMKVDYAVASVAYTITTGTAATLSLRTSQHYWAPVGKSLGGSAVEVAPPGAGDYLETRYETQVVNASSENTIQLTNRGGMIKGVLLISRAAGVRTEFTAGANVGLILDNQAIDEGIPIEEQLAEVRRATGYIGAQLTTSYAPLTAGTLPGDDRGVFPFLFDIATPQRDAWLKTLIGSLLQVKVTPGASATQLEVVTQLMQVKDLSAFYSR